MWGRIKLIRRRARRRPLHRRLPAVLEIDNRQQLGNEAYAWCWAAAKFSIRIRAIATASANCSNTSAIPISTTSSASMYRGDWAELQAEWQAFIATLEYGYDFERMAIDFQPRQAARRTSCTVDDRGRSRLAVVGRAARSGQVVSRHRSRPLRDRQRRRSRGHASRAA